jgi:hypothetical protein
LNPTQDDRHGQEGSGTRTPASGPDDEAVDHPPDPTNGLFDPLEARIAGEGPLEPAKGDSTPIVRPREPTAADVARWLRPTVEPGSVIELRILGVLDNPKYPKFTIAGYFDSDHLDELASNAMAWTRRAEGVYVTINPCLPDLLARAANRVVKRPAQTTRDAEIVRRSGLVIDADPVRPAGISASRQEKELARERITQVAADLKGRGWPGPIGANSGNGYHARYKIDLPADDGGLVERVLKALDALWSDELVKIDVSLFNPSRIIKLHGTLARKGDPTAERPHRWSHVLFMPDDFQVVPIELLEALATQYQPHRPSKPARATPRDGGGAKTARGDSGSGEPGLRPGDDFNEKATWAEVLEPHGWKVDRVAGGVTYWTRPGKDRGTSATTGYNAGLHCFSSSAAPFEANQNYSRFAVYAMLEHSGDFSAAAQALAKKGYGSRPARSEPSPNSEVAPAAKPESGLPTIVCGSEEPTEGLKTWTPKAIAALARANRDQAIGIYQRGGLLVRIKRTETDAAPILEPLSRDALRGELDRAACWAIEFWTSNGPIRKYGPPGIDIARDVLALKEYDQDRFPPLDMIVESPRFLPDGTLILTPGYHAGGRLYYAPSTDLAEIVVPEAPTDEQVEQAKSLLFGHLLVDFPFANQASRANALAVTLLAFVREMIDGATPNHHFGASTEGTGKGLLAAACAFPALGREIELTPQKENEAEWRKALTSSFMSGATHFFLDNITLCPLDSGTLAAAWTVRFWRDRILGGNKEARAKVQTVFISTGNNVIFSRELDRRTVSIELLAPRENPSLRTGFKHDPLIDWARANRRTLVEACLTLVRRWIADGMPPGGQAMGSYGNYARVMGGILGSCGVEKFLANRARRVAANPEAARWNLLVSEWYRLRQTTLISTAELWDLIMGLEGLGERFHDLLGDGGHLSQKQRLGKALERAEGRVFTATVEKTPSEWRLVRSDATTANKTALWRLQDPKVRLEEDSEDEDHEPVPF